MDAAHSGRKRAEMADGPEKLSSQLFDRFLSRCSGKTGLDYLTSVSDFVSKFKGETVILMKPAGATLKVAGLHDTIYTKEDKNEWGKFYLPEVASMQVVGVVTGKSCPCDQLVLMTCEDREIYAYDGEELNVVASSLEQLRDEGIEYPASENYYRGEAFKDMVYSSDPKMGGAPSGRKRAEMAGGPEKLSSQLFDRFLSRCSGKTGLDYLKSVSDFVSKFKGETVILKKPAGATLKVAGLHDTIYTKEDKNEWGKFYLPKVVSMQVVGVVEGTSCPCDQLVLMTSEDRKIYAYDGEELHVVASSLEQLCDEGIEYPASENYYRGEAFKDMTDEDWDKVRNGPVGRRLDEEHRDLVQKLEIKFTEAAGVRPSDTVCT